MWKLLSARQCVLLRLIKSRESRRTFLSEAYRCTDVWNNRLQSPLLSKVNSGEMFLQLDQKFQSTGKASAIDVDIYANVLTEPDHQEELMDTMHKLRLSTEATNILDSTHHAVIRYLLDNNEVQDLLTVLHDRINYGIFPDYHSYNVMMDTFLKRKDYASAAKTAVLLMLQEDNSHPISNALAIYSCYKFLENPEGWMAPEPPPEDNGEEIKIRVNYIINPWFDDHFDLVEPDDLVGKTLIFFGKSVNDSVGRSCHLQGLVLRKKYKAAADLVSSWTKDGNKKGICIETFAKIQQKLDTISEDKATEEIKELRFIMKSFDKTCLEDKSIIEDLTERVKTAVRNQAEADISLQLQIYKKWEETRKNLLQKQLDDLDKKARLEEVERMKKEMFERERLLTFFEKESQIELQIAEKLCWEKEKYGPIIKSDEDIQDSYVPPEVIKKRREG